MHFILFDNEPFGKVWGLQKQSPTTIRVFVFELYVAAHPDWSFGWQFQPLHNITEIEDWITMPLYQFRLLGSLWRFVRENVLIDSIKCDWGIIEPWLSDFVHQSSSPIPDFNCNLLLVAFVIFHQFDELFTLGLAPAPIFGQLNVVSDVISTAWKPSTEILLHTIALIAVEQCQILWLGCRWCPVKCGGSVCILPRKAFQQMMQCLKLGLSFL